MKLYLPAKSPLVAEESAAIDHFPEVKLPKSIAFPVEAISTKSITSESTEPV